MSGVNMENGVRLYSVPLDLSLQVNHCLLFSCYVSRYFWRMDKDILTCNLYLHHPPTHNYPSIHPSFSAKAASRCIQLSESLFHVTVSLERTCAGSPEGFWCPVAPDGDRWGCFHSPSQTTLVSHAGGIVSAKSDRRSQGVHMCPQTLLWSTLWPTGNQKVLLRHLHGLGWGRGPGAKLPIWVWERVAELASIVHSYQPFFLLLWTVSFS